MNLPSLKKARRLSHTPVGLELAATLMDANGGTTAMELHADGVCERKNFAILASPREVDMMTEERGEVETPGGISESDRGYMVGEVGEVGRLPLNAHVVPQVEVPSVQGDDCAQRGVGNGNMNIEIIDVDALPDVEDESEGVTPRDNNATVEGSACEIIDVDALCDIDDKSDGIAEDMGSAAMVMASHGPGDVVNAGLGTEGHVMQSTDLHLQEHSTCQEPVLHVTGGGMRAGGLDDCVGGVGAGMQCGESEDDALVHREDVHRGLHQFFSGAADDGSGEVEMGDLPREWESLVVNVVNDIGNEMPSHFDEDSMVDSGEREKEHGVNEGKLAVIDGDARGTAATSVPEIDRLQQNQDEVGSLADLMHVPAGWNGIDIAKEGSQRAASRVSVGSSRDHLTYYPRGIGRAGYCKRRRRRTAGERTNIRARALALAHAVLGDRQKAMKGNG